MNYEIHGNTVPHLHTHLYPRFPGDPFTGRPIDGRAQEFERSPEQIEHLAQAIQKAASQPASRSASTLDPSVVYDDMASWFDQQSGTSFYNAHYDRPAVLELAGDVAGQTVLDAGCGAGHYLTALHERGAHPVGIDASAELLNRARARVGDEIELIHHDLNQPLSMLGDGSFDGAVLALVYEHVDNRAGLLAELRRILKPGGWLVVSESHPVVDWFQFGGSYFDVERIEAVFD